MDANKPIIEEIAAAPKSRADAAAAKFVWYRSLLLRNKAVWKERNAVWISSAGENPIRRRLICPTGQEAKRLVITLSTELRKARSNDEYNAILMRLLQEIRSAWPDNVKVRHVHTCDRGNSGQACAPDASGVTPCGFDWRMHQLTRECECRIEIDDSDASGEWQFWVHRNYRKAEMVAV